MNGFKIARISGVEVRVDWSLLIVFFLVLNSLALGVFPSWHPEWGARTIWLTALAAAILFFASVLFHELAHALVGRRMGVVIRRITLFVFGGMAHVEHEPRRWRAEFLMAAAGPVSSLLLGFACLALARAATGPLELDPENPAQYLAQLGPASTLLAWLGQVNILLALFNLVPGFPLDGGRVLRSLLWAYTGSLRKATRWASFAGQGFAWVLIGLGFAMMIGFRFPVLGGGLVGGLWLAFIGWFLNNAALVSYKQLLAREALEDVPVSRLMLTRFETTGPETPLGTLIDEQLLRSGQHAFPVVEGQRLVGMICLRDIQNLSASRRAAARVADVMTPRERVVSVSPDTDAFDALNTLGRYQINQLPVLEGEIVRGLVRREDVLNWLALHSDADDWRLKAQPS